MRNVPLEATEMGKNSCYFLREAVWLTHEHTPYSSKVYRREEIFQINIEYPTFPYVLLRVGLYALPHYESMYARFGSINGL